ncbi:MAG: ATP-binding cassette domain-containing protein [Leucobacter sp.]|jgi:ABC-2 type transport system ATP-binding protein|uniref:ATP-binding cassette domain-containing protein n=1 Tax=Micrococcales TaxID=85006 RepID=UPI003F91BF60
MLPTTIRLDGASVFFGKLPALDGFTGAFTPGTVTALIGGDGAGKSTLLRLLAGRLAAHSGTTTGLPVDRTSVGYQPADSGVWRNLSVAENIEFVTCAYGIDPQQSRARAEELLALAGLDQVTSRLAGRLSGGMRQKLGVILATLHRPGLVLLDEPTSGVDPISRAELWSLIAGAAADGATVVFATTYLDEAERASRLFLLGDGNLLAAGTPDEVIAHTPGVIWQAPITLDAAGRELASQQAWRRAGTVYRWEATAAAVAPDGFAPAPGDLENTSIALLLSTDTGTETTAGLPDTGSTPAPGGDGPLVEASDVSRRYGSFTALDGVSLSVEPGEIVGLLGGNGAGKTTLMRILLGLETATTGQTTLFGAEPSLDTRRRIGYVAQGLGLYPSLSAIENLDFAASVHGIPVTEHARAFAAGFGRTPIGSLPLGTKRILAYLAASGHHPELLVLDEPTSGMDALTRARLWRNLRSSADNGTGILVTTHYMQEATQCDRLVILTGGRITAAGTAADITASHRSLVVRTEHWEDAFVLLRAAGLGALLDGRTLRLPGADRDQVTAALTPLTGAMTITEAQATLEETMMLATRNQHAT